MRFHTLALTATLAYVAKKPIQLGRYQFRIVMEFTKRSPSRSTGLERGSYFVTLNLSYQQPASWEIEKVVNDRPYNKDTNYPDLKKFEFAADGSALILIDHSKAKEYSIEIKSDNRRGIEVRYQSAYGYGAARGEFTSELDQLTIVDDGPNPQKEHARIDAVIRFDEIKKL